MFTKLFVLLFLIFAGVKNNPEGLVDWNQERRLTWEDFQGKPDPTTGNAALTSTSINIDYSYNKRELKYSIRCQFDPAKSWGRVRNNHILGHEQAHFDIAEIHARYLYKTLQEYKFRSSTVNEDIARMYEAVMQKHHEMQSQYDSETDYSRKPTIQKEWEEHIAKSLNDLAAYANYK
jgi:predicted secreted Zn-dependent protease